jgi:thymidylate synthase ThyX
VRLVEWDEDGEAKVLAGILFTETHTGWDEALKSIKSFSPEKRKDLLSRYLKGRSARWYKVGRALENAYVRFEITMDAGSYRDLHRHRMMTQDRQRFSTHHGYDLPPELIESGLKEKYMSALEVSATLFEKIEKLDPDLAQYVVPMAYRVRFYQWQNLRQLFWEAELRTISQGHPNYRYVEQEKYRLVKEKYPLIGEEMLVDMNDYSIARRGTEEKIEEKERMIVEKLKNRGDQS